MKQIYSILLVSLGFLVISQCTSNTTKHSDSPTDSSTSKQRPDTVVVFVGINNKGVGRFKNVMLQLPLNEDMVTKGKAIYQSKCLACHKLSSEMLVGPGWAGVTTRRTPEWIMNWITNTRVMLDKDLAAQSELSICLIRMPNQDLTDQQAREVLEYMRKNDTPGK
jgi:hypothetical protein